MKFMKTDYVKYKIANIINIQKIVTLHYFEFECTFNYKKESHDFWEMVYVDKGKLQVKAGNRELTLSQGECFFHKPNEFHMHSANGVVAPNIVIISFVCNSQSMKFFKSKHIKVPEKLRGLISEIINEGKKTFNLPFNDPDLKQLQLRNDSIIGGQQMVRIYLEQFLIMLLRHECNEENTNVFSSRETMMEHLAVQMQKKLDTYVYKRISVEEFCREMKYSKAYLSKIFLKNYGCSISTYIAMVKVSEAKKLIREHTYNFSQISDMLCFSNPFYFSRVFRRVTGMSPTEYKQSVKID
ncbi:MAG: AraC family transcriptional regulator [Clostridia bacterium]|nr:AraC family transcriptional regulator [Clostridia bacterium]